MTTSGYARISMNRQGVDAQVQQLAEAGCENIYRETAGQRGVIANSPNEIADGIGRPRKLDSALNSIAEGKRRSAAAHFAGVDVSTLRRALNGA